MAGTVLLTDVARRQVRAAAGVIPPGVAHAVECRRRDGLDWFPPWQPPEPRLAADSHVKVRTRDV